MCSLRGWSHHRPGGQPGYPGDTLRQSEHPGHSKIHRPPQCGGCDTPLAESGTAGASPLRQVFDLPAPQPLEVLRFLPEPEVPFTKNQAEQDLRMGKARQKISGGFNSVQGTQDLGAL